MARQRRRLAHAAADRVLHDRGRSHDHVCARAQEGTFGPMGLDADERHYRPHPCCHHPGRVARHGGVGRGIAGCHQHAVRRHRADRDGHARPLRSEHPAGAEGRLERERLTDKGNSTVTRILEEAKNILVKDRFLGLSFRAIAKRTGTTVGNIGYYYGTKDDLMVGLAEYIFDKWELRLQREMPPAITDKRETFRYLIRSMIDQNKQRKTMFLLLEMWAMANRSQAVSKMMDTFYGRLRNSIDGMIADLNPGMTAETRALRAALITTQIEGLMILVGPGKPRHSELSGIEDEAMLQIEKMALAP